MHTKRTSTNWVTAAAHTYICKIKYASVRVVMSICNMFYVDIQLINVNMRLKYMIVLECNRLHVKIIILHVDINMSHVHRIMLQVEPHLPCM